eukprot:1408139-Alexandrium_andersonii.AAC.1
MHHAGRRPAPGLWAAAGRRGCARGRRCHSAPRGCFRDLFYAPGVRVLFVSPTTPKRAFVFGQALL